MQFLRIMYMTLHNQRRKGHRKRDGKRERVSSDKKRFCFSM